MNSDLVFLKDTAVFSGKKVNDYLKAAVHTELTNIFMEIAKDEVGHLILTIQQLYQMSPEETELLPPSILDIKPLSITQKAAVPAQPSVGLSNIANPYPLINYLKRTLDDELMAIEKYQAYMEKSENEACQKLFCRLMNGKQRHVAKFTEVLYRLIQDPLLHDAP